MSSVKIYFKKSKKYSDNTCPVLLVFTQKGKKPISKVLFSIEPIHWDERSKQVKSSHPLYLHLNEKIKKENKEALSRLIQSENEEKKIDPSFVLNKKAHSSTLVSNKTIRELSIEFLREKKQVVAGSTYLNYKGTLEKVNETIGHLKVGEINKSTSTILLEALKSRKNNNNSIHQRFQILNVMLKWAGVNEYIPPQVKTTKVIKSQLSAEELEILEKHTMELKSKYQEAIDTFLMQVYCYGARISDILLLKKSQISEGTIQIIQRKTGKLASVKRHSKMNAIIEKYINRPGEFLFNWLEGKIPIEDNPVEFNVKFAKLMYHQATYVGYHLGRACKILIGRDNITPHMARHTFSRLARNNNIDISTIQKALGHSKITTTAIYLGQLTYEDIHDKFSKFYENDLTPARESLPANDLKSILKEKLKSMTMQEILTLISED